jgi:hypothetical protein
MCLYTFMQINVTPVFNTLVTFSTFEKLLPGSENNTSTSPKYQLTFFPLRAARDMRLVSASACHELDISIRCKVEHDIFMKIAPLLQDKTNEAFELEVLPETYKIAGNSGLYYKFFNLTPSLLAVPV